MRLSPFATQPMADQRLAEFLDPALSQPDESWRILGFGLCRAGGLRRRGHRMKRRNFITSFCVTAAWAVAARAQQKAIPVIGYLSSRSPSDSQDILAAFRQGLNEAGFIEKHNVLIEYRFAEFNFDRLSGLAADLVR